MQAGSARQQVRTEAGGGRLRARLKPGLRVAGSMGLACCCLLLACVDRAPGATFTPGSETIDSGRADVDAAPTAAPDSGPGPSVDASTPADATTSAGGGAPDAAQTLDAATTDPPASVPPALDSLQVTLLEEASTQDGARFKLLRLQYPGHPATYAQFYPPVSGTQRPVVVVTKPYDGIGFTGEEVDQRWAALGTGLHPDVDAPGAGPSPGAIGYTLLDPTTADDGALFRLHDMGVLLLYGRFYAGGDVQNDIEDMTTGLDFLFTTGLVDRSRIGIWGASWGGFEALYAAAYAREGVRPRVGGALSPLSDFARQLSFVTQDLPALYAQPASREAAATFFDPYLRRIEPTRAARGGFAGLQGSDIAERIDGPFLLIHDDWDTLVSFDQSQALHALAPATFSSLWLLHEAPPSAWDPYVNDHGPLLTQFQNPALTFLLTFVLNELADVDQPLTTLWDPANMRALSLHMLSLQRAGMNVDFYASRLRDLADSRVTISLWDGSARYPGPDMVAAEVNAVWGTAYVGSTVRAALATGLPPAP